MKTHSLKYRILRGMLSVLGFGSMAACNPPEMYGPDVLPNGYMYGPLMYGPSPNTEYLPDNAYPQVQPSAVDMPLEDAGEESGENE